MPNNSESGVSLIITFFILVIVLAVVLSISVILYSELKIIRNIGDSVVAFYAAESGIEKTLYYDRKVLPENMAGSKRGICNMCNYETCISKTIVAGDLNGCEDKTCENCEVKFDTDLLNGKKYTVTAKVLQIASQDDPPVKFSELSINSVGSYNFVFGADPIKRAIEINVQKDELAGGRPDQTSLALVVDPSSIGRNGTVNLSATLKDSGGNPALGQQIDFSGAPSAIPSCTIGATCSSISYKIPSNATYKKYTIIANFLGDSSYAPASGTADLYVARSTVLTADMSSVPATGGTTYVYATLKSGTSNLSNKNLALKNTIGGTLASGITGSDGSVIMFYTVPASAPGTYYFTVNFDGDSSYLPSFANVSLIVTP